MSPPSGGGAPGVGIVVVSHSRALATAAVALAAEMLGGSEPRIAIAAGLDETTFGTDAVQIATAIGQVDGDAGVVVLMDLGSAVLSAELALDLLEDAAVRDRVLLSPAPLVEGLVVAAVVAAGGGSRQEVAAEARSALLGKAAQLAPEDTAGAEAVDDGPPIVATFTVDNPHGLHARPAARLVGEVRRLDAAVTVRNVTTGSGPVPAGSLSRVATLGALRGHVVEVAASGSQAQAVLDHVLALARRRFDETDDAAATAGSARPSVEQPPGTPLPAAPGIGIGPARRLTVAGIVVDDFPSGPPAVEWRRLVEAVADVRRDIEQLRTSAMHDAGAEEAGIFDAHLLLLDDDELVGEAKARVEGGASAAGAWAASAAAVEQQWAALPDPYLRARAADVRAVAEQVLRDLAGEVAVPLVVVDGVLVAQDLTPAQAAVLDTERVRAVVLAGGSATSHASIVIRSLGIPAVVAAGPAVLEIPEGTLLIVDGTAGRVIVDPAEDVLEEYGREMTRLGELRARNVGEAVQPALTGDGVLIEVTSNVGSVADARAAVAAGADGAGLVRTEFLFLDRDRPPSGDEQEHDYRAMAEAFGGRPVTIRTLDVGGDKPLRYLRQDPEANPFLGQRGLRLSLARPDLLTEQLGAICRVARTAPVKVMFPMVTTVDELLTARRLLEDAAGPGGLPPSLRIGMMVEVPATALNIEAFLPHVDFVSIGTNDLTQYTLAVERGNAAVASLADPLDPAVLRLVAEVGRRSAGRATVSVCGEVASDPPAVPVLLGLGVTELSVSPAAVPAVKAAVRELDLHSCADLAERCLQAGSAAEVRRLVAEAGDVLPRPAGGLRAAPPPQGVR
jgi:phosphoenolpyruvate-protein phosphotransferase/dihydroxyacetone kinase phosphotransfer subunit